MERISYFGIGYDRFEKHVNIDMDPGFLRPLFCRDYARHLLAEKHVLGMTERQIAREIYAHAACFYWHREKGGFLHCNSFTAMLKSHGADGILIESGGDTGFRRFAYVLIWFFRPVSIKSINIK